MKPAGRKLIAVGAIVAAGVMLWLERHRIAAGSGESWFWIAVACLVALLAAAELAGFGSTSGGVSDRGPAEDDARDDRDDAAAK
jgi:hypothetical protein